MGIIDIYTVGYSDSWDYSGYITNFLDSSDLLFSFQIELYINHIPYVSVFLVIRRKMPYT